MVEKLHERVSVLATYNRDNATPQIHKVKWNGRAYQVTQLGYYYRYRQGGTIIHVFHVCSCTIAFKLVFDTEYLTWWVEEVADGNAN